jgi:hypothetical protein
MARAPALLDRVPQVTVQAVTLAPEVLPRCPGWATTLIPIAAWTVEHMGPTFRVSTVLRGPRNGERLDVAVPLRRVEGTLNALLGLVDHPEDFELFLKDYGPIGFCPHWIPLGDTPHIVSHVRTRARVSRVVDDPASDPQLYVQGGSKYLCAHSAAGVHPYALYRALARRADAVGVLTTYIHSADQGLAPWPTRGPRARELLEVVTLLEQLHPTVTPATTGAGVAHDAQAHQRALVAAELGWWRQRSRVPLQLTWTRAGTAWEVDPGMFTGGVLEVAAGASLWFALTEALTRRVVAPHGLFAGEPGRCQAPGCGKALQPHPLDKPGRPKEYCETHWPQRRRINKRKETDKAKARRALAV